MILRASRISKKKYNALLKCFVLDQQASVAAEMAKVNKNTAGLWYRHWREAIYAATARHRDVDDDYVG